MLAITVHQPMAHAILHLGKHTENRPARSPWHLAIGSTVALHAARRGAWNQAYADDIEQITGRRITPDDVDFSAVIGTIDIGDVHWSRHEPLEGDCCQPWGFDGQSHLTITRARAIAQPVPVRGALGLWRLPDDVARVLEAVRA